MISKRRQNFNDTLKKIVAEDNEGFSFEDFLGREDSTKPGDNTKYAAISFALSLPMELFGLSDEAT